MHCIHCASSLYGKLGDEMTGRFNQDLPENLHTAFEKAANFKLYTITKQSINERRVHDINNIDVTQGLEEIEINEAHIWNPNYKGKNYDPNYQQNKNKNNFNNNSSTGTSYQNNGNQGQGNHYTKNYHQEKPGNVSVTLNGPVSKEQLYKIQEVLRHPSQYRDRLKPEDRPVTGEYAKSFNKFRPKKVEVHEATVEEAIKFGQYLKRNKEDIAEAIDIYKSLGNDTFYGPEEESTAEPQEQQDQCLPSQYDPDAYYNTVQTSAPRQIDCFTIALGKKTGTTFPITFNNNQNYNALYDTGAGASLINYSAYVSLGKELNTGYQPYVKNASGEDMGALGQVTCTFTINSQLFTQSFIVCRHMTRPIILRMDFTSTNFVGIIWTREGT